LRRISEELERGLNGFNGLIWIRLFISYGLALSYLATKLVTVGGVDYCPCVA